MVQNRKRKGYFSSSFSLCLLPAFSAGSQLPGSSVSGFCVPRIWAQGLYSPLLSMTPDGNHAQCCLPAALSAKDLRSAVWLASGQCLSFPAFVLQLRFADPERTVRVTPFSPEGCGAWVQRDNATAEIHLASLK